MSDTCNEEGPEEFTCELAPEHRDMHMGKRFNIIKYWSQGWQVRRNRTTWRS